jgi:hypothetical protein
MMIDGVGKEEGSWRIIVWLLQRLHSSQSYYFLVPRHPDCMMLFSNHFVFSICDSKDVCFVLKTKDMDGV